MVAPKAGLEQFSIPAQLAKLQALPRDEDRVKALQEALAKGELDTKNAIEIAGLLDLRKHFLEQLSEVGAGRYGEYTAYGPAPERPKGSSSPLMAQVNHMNLRSQTSAPGVPKTANHIARLMELDDKIDASGQGDKNDAMAFLESLAKHDPADNEHRMAHFDKGAAVVAYARAHQKEYTPAELRLVERFRKLASIPETAIRKKTKSMKKTSGATEASLNHVVRLMRLSRQIPATGKCDEATATAFMQSLLEHNPADNEDSALHIQQGTLVLSYMKRNKLKFSKKALTLAKTAMERFNNDG